MSVATERRDGVFLIGLDRAERRNALDSAMITSLHQSLDDAAAEACVVIVHSTTPGIFAAGADIEELLERTSEHALRRINVDLFDRLERHRWPTIAAVDGPAMGAGCELALACDLRICSPRSRFAQPEASLGIVAGAGGNWRLAHLVGVAMARRMLYLGEVVGADDALACGLADRVDEDPLALSLRLAAEIGARSWRALELTKLALAIDRPSTTAFDVVAQALSFDSEEKRERMQSFLDRRAAKGSRSGDA